MANNFNDLFNTPDTSYEYDTQDIQSNKVWAVLAYLGILFFLPLVACKDSRFGKFHANQGFALFLTDLVVPDHTASHRPMSHRNVSAALRATCFRSCCFVPYR